MVMSQSVSEYVFLAKRRSTPAGVASSSRLSTQGSQIGGSAGRFSVVANELSTASELPLECFLHFPVLPKHFQSVLLTVTQRGVLKRRSQQWPVPTPWE